MLNVEVLPELRDTLQVFHFHEALFGNEVCWFQDGAPPHRANLVMQRLHELFGNQVVPLHQQPQE